MVTMESGELVCLNYSNLTDLPKEVLEEYLFRENLEKLYLKQNLITDLVIINSLKIAYYLLLDVVLHVFVSCK